MYRSTGPKSPKFLENGVGYSRSFLDIAYLYVRRVTCRDCNVKECSNEGSLLESVVVPLRFDWGTMLGLSLIHI